MNIANLYRKIKQILEDSNNALINRGLQDVNNLFQIPSEIESLGEINRLPYLLRKEIIEISEEDIGNITSLNKYMFYRQNNLENISIPESVTHIGEAVFKSCTSLKNINIPEGVTYIGNYAFEDCALLENISIPASVTQIHSYVFSSCSNLTDIYLHASTPPTLSGELWRIGENYLMKNCKIHVPPLKKILYSQATNWSKYASQIIEDESM